MHMHNSNDTYYLCAAIPTVQNNHIIILYLFIMHYIIITYIPEPCHFILTLPLPPAINPLTNTLKFPHRLVSFLESYSICRAHHQLVPELHVHFVLRLSHTVQCLSVFPGSQSIGWLQTYPPPSSCAMNFLHLL